VDLRTVAESAAGYIGTNPLDREQHYQRGKNGPAMAVLDIVLWDLLGKMTDLPVYALLGGYRTKVPAYASTIDGAVKGPLSNPETYADFAQQCLEMGYKAFKIHPFVWADVQTHIDAVLALGDRVGGKMDLMLDSFNWYQTFADALKVGRACDEAGFFWYEDPYSDGGWTPWSHARLREMIRTPLLQGEKVKTMEQRMDLILQKATDYIRGDVGQQGLTGTMKLAHAAESVGMDIEPHTAGPENLHFMAAVKNANYYEVVWGPPQRPRLNHRRRGQERQLLRSSVGPPQRPRLQSAHLQEHERYTSGLHRQRRHGRGPGRPWIWNRVRLGLHRQRQYR